MAGLAQVFALLWCLCMPGLHSLRRSSRGHEQAKATETASASWGLDRIGAGSRRSKFQGRGVHIFVVDGGVRTTHQDFGGRATPAVDFTTGRWGSHKAKECNGDIRCAVDEDGRGTFAAGIAAGAVHGVAPQALVHSVKAIKSSDNSEYHGSSSPGRTAAVLKWIATTGLQPAVAAMTMYGGGFQEGSCGRTVKEAADALIAAGVTLVVSAGEGRHSGDACGRGPNCVPSAITVGATYLNAGQDVKWMRGNHGKCIDLWAPGPGVKSITNTDDTASATTEEAFGNVDRSGTAAAHVAGAAAVLLEASPDFRAQQVSKQLLSDASVDYIHSLGGEDNNRMLYIGEDAPLPRGQARQVAEAEVKGEAAAPEEAEESEARPATGLPCRGTGMSVGMWKVEGGLATSKGETVDDTFQLYFNITKVQNIPGGDPCDYVRWWFDETRSIIAGEALRNWIGWDIPNDYRMFPYEVRAHNTNTPVSPPYYISDVDTRAGPSEEHARWRLCNIDGVCYTQMMIESDQSRIKLWDSARRQYLVSRNPMQKL